MRMLAYSYKHLYPTNLPVYLFRRFTTPSYAYTATYRAYMTSQRAKYLDELERWLNYEDEEEGEGGKEGT
ncbi:hypothetical protein N0V94_007587, partial [Neodidymelliopsis sp. IMI 364377]